METRADTGSPRTGGINSSEPPRGAGHLDHTGQQVLLTAKTTLQPLLPPSLLSFFICHLVLVYCVGMLGEGKEQPTTGAALSLHPQES